VTVALEHLKNGARDKKILIVVSDGADNASVRAATNSIRLQHQAATAFSCTMVSAAARISFTSSGDEASE